MINNALSFSDSAKFADIARNLVYNFGFGNSFSFFSATIFQKIKSFPFQNIGILPITPYSIYVFFKIFGVGDFAVIATSFFYFILALIFVFLLARKIWKSNLVGILSTLAVGFNYDLINYATNGASEAPFIFEITAALYFASFKKKWATVVCAFFLILMYFTRPQAFIYIAGIVLFWLLINFGTKKALIYFAIISFTGLIFDRLVLWNLAGKYFLYSIVGRAIGSSFDQTQAASNALRGASVSLNLTQVFKNIFYNLYNFYKLLPQIINPYLFTLFTVGLFYKSNRQFKTASLFMVVVTFLVAAASIPFFRYLHPVIPFVYIIAVGTLVEIISKFQKTNYKQITIFKYKISKQASLIFISCFLVLFMAVGQTLGIIFLDSRFERKAKNIGKPPVYVVLSRVLKENTKLSDIIITNLDTWGSWYGERKTVWYPLTPKQLTDPATGKIPFDAIYLTSYLIDDENYYMGEDWRQIFENPLDPKKWTCAGCPEIVKEFSLKGVYKINADSDYEKTDAKSILLIKITNNNTQAPNK